MKKAGKILILIGFMVFAVGLFINVLKCPDLFRRSLAVYVSIFIAIFGVCFSFAKGKTPTNFGTAFSAFSGLFGFLILKESQNYGLRDNKVVLVIAVGLFIMFAGAFVKFIIDLIFSVCSKE